MSASELALVIVTICSVAAVVVLAFCLYFLKQSLSIMRRSVEEMREETLAVVQDLHRAVGVAQHELERVDDVLSSAASVGSMLDSASRLAYLAMSTPVIKAMALGSGTAKAAKVLRRK